MFEMRKVLRLLGEGEGEGEAEPELREPVRVEELVLELVSGARSLLKQPPRAVVRMSKTRRTAPDPRGLGLKSIRECLA